MGSTGTRADQRRPMLVIVVALLALPAAQLAPARANAEADGAELIGTPAPEWTVSGWIQSQPLSLRDLRGKVTLLRWWTDTCPYCSASAPALRALHERYAERGLVVIGMYHPKPHGREVRTDEIRSAAERLGLPFPIALDLDWSTLRRYWLDDQRGRATSVTFLIDREGRIRHIHPGPLYLLEPRRPNDPAHRDYLELRAAVDPLL